MAVDATPSDDLDEVERRLAMSLVDAMLTERTVRGVLPDPVAPGIVRRCIELALEAPPASNGQNWEFVVVTEHEIKARLQLQYQRFWSLYGWAGHHGGWWATRFRSPVSCTRCSGRSTTSPRFRCWSSPVCECG